MTLALIGILLGECAIVLDMFPRLGITIGLAGRTHGGRLRPPFVGPILVPSKYGRFLDRGPFRFGGSLLHIISGFGYSPGSGCPAEIVRLSIRPSPDRATAPIRGVVPRMASAPTDGEI